MADIVQGTVTGLVDTTQIHRDFADVRHEQTEDTCRINDNVKSSAWHVSDVVGRETDRLLSDATSYFINGINRDYMGMLANLKEHNQTQTSILTTSAATQSLIAADGQKTRDLMNQTTIDDLRARLACCCVRGNSNGNGNS